MAREWLDFGEKLPGFRFKDGNRILRPCKCSHGLQRVKQVHHHEFDLILALLSQDVSASIAIDLLEAGKHLLLEQPLPRDAQGDEEGKEDGLSCGMRKLPSVG